MLKAEVDQKTQNKMTRFSVNYRGLVRFFILFLALIISGSCSYKAKDSKITFHISDGAKFFVFSTIDDEKKNLYKITNSNSFIEISDSDISEIKSAIYESKYCLNKYGDSDFVLTSRQVTSYDNTFYSFISKVHNLKEKKIISYYGKCS